MNDEDFRRHSDESMPVLLHRMDVLEKRVDAGFEDIGHRLDNLSFVRSDVYAEQQAAMRDRLAVVEKKLEVDGEVAQHITAAASSGKWALNLMIGAFVIAMVGALVGFVLQGAG